MNKIKIFKILLKLIKRYSDHSFYKLIILLMLAFIIESISTASIIPLLSFLTDSNYVDSNDLIKTILVYVGVDITSYNSITYTFILLFFSSYFIKVIIFVYLYSVQSKFIYNLSSSLSKNLFINYINKSYSFHIDRNSSVLVQNITSEINTLTTMINQGLIIVTDSLIFLSIFIVVLFYNPLGGLITFFLIGFVGGYLFYFVFKNYILKLGEDRQKYEKLTINNILESFSGIKEIKIFNLEKFFNNRFIFSRQKVADVGRNQLFVSQMPRLWIEIIAIFLISIFIISLLISNQNLLSYVPTIGLLVSAAFRLLPSSSRLVSALQVFDFSIPAINIISKELLKNKKINSELDNIKDASNLYKYRINFESKLKLNSIDFKYDNSSKYIFKNLNFEIKKNSSIGIVGDSGSGKSTLIDIIMGLLKPTKGKYLIDGKTINFNNKLLHNIIGYVPQTIFLIDDSIKNNIAFGIKEKNIDSKKLHNAIEAAGLREFVNNSENKLDTLVGERGVRISGGQRQRIGIARALYNNPEILILDESTSSLDIENEKKIVNTIKKLQGKKTIIIVSHRLSTVKNVHYLYKVKDRNVFLKSTNNVFKADSKNKIFNYNLSLQKEFLQNINKKINLEKGKKKTAVLFVGYNYLSTPLYESLKKQLVNYNLKYVFTKDTIASKTNFINFDKSSLSKDKNFLEIKHNPMWHGPSSLSSMNYFIKRFTWFRWLFSFYNYKIQLRRMFDKLDPDIVLSTSDLFFTTRFFSKIKTNIPILLIQPCYLDLWKRPYLNYYSKKITNFFIPYFFEKQQYFGFEVNNINILLWDLNSYEIFKIRGKKPYKIINPTHISLLNKSSCMTHSDKKRIINNNKLNIDENKKILSIFTAFYGDVLGHGDKYQKNLEESLNFIFENLKKKFNIIIKVHPNEETSYWKNNFANHDLIIKEINNFDLMLISDIMISTNSYASVEATLLGITNINFVPGVDIVSKDFCNIFNHYSSHFEYSKEALLDLLLSYLNNNIDFKNDIINAQNNILGIDSNYDNFSVEEIMEIKTSENNN